MFTLLKKIIYDFLPWWFKLRKNCHIGKKFKTGIFVNIENNGVHIGNYVYVVQLSYIGPHTEIGNFCMISDSVNIIGHDHEYKLAGIPIILSGRPKDDLKTIIKDDVWIGHGATILRGITIGEGAIIAANSVVTKDIEPYTIVAGIPAKAIKRRFNEREIDTHHKFLQKYRKTGNLNAIS